MTTIIHQRALLVGAMALGLACNGPTTPDLSTAAYVGPVASIQSGDRMLVQYRAPGASTVSHVVVIVTSETSFRLSSGRRARLSDVQPGDSVAVWATGEMRSLPPQAFATALVRLGGRDPSIFER